MFSSPFAYGLMGNSMKWEGDFGNFCRLGGRLGELGDPQCGLGGFTKDFFSSLIEHLMLHKYYILIIILDAVNTFTFVSFVLQNILLLG